jgi:hypothetical protein
MIGQSSNNSNGNAQYAPQMNSSQVDTNGRSLFIDPSEKPYQIQIKIIDSRYYTYASFDRETKKKGKDKDDVAVKCTGESGKIVIVNLY